MPPSERIRRAAVFPVTAARFLNLLCGVKAMAYDLTTMTGWLVDQVAAVSGADTVTYRQTGRADVTGLGVAIGQTTQEQLDQRDGTLLESKSTDFIFVASELGRTPAQGDVVIRSDGSKYKVLPLGPDEQCFRERGEMLRVFTRRIATN